MLNLIKEIENTFDDMTDSHKKVATYVIHNAEESAFLTLEEMAEKIGVSTTTVIRFARSLGFNGYTAFLEHVQKYIRAKVGLPERLHVTVDNIDHDDLLLQTFNQDIANIQATLQTLSSEKLTATIDMIMSAKTIYVIGLRSSFCLAHYFATALGQIRENVRLIEAVGATYPEEIISVKENDLCIAFSFPRNARVTLEVTRWMKSEGVKVIAVTNSVLSPMSEIADLLLSCEVKGVLFKASPAAPMSLINYIIASVATRDKEGAYNMLSKTEKLLRQGHYFAT